MHEATSVLRHIYFRVIAIRGRDGDTVVMGSIDSQGYSIAYQNGPYGFSDVESYIQNHLGIPAGNIILQATHSHNGPDEIGVWGGVPDTYMAFVTQSMENAITQAVAQEQPALLKVGTADMTGFSGTFGSDDDSTHTGDNQDYPMDNQLRVLQAVTPDPTHAVIATMVNYSTHATIYGPRNQVAPDWPGSTATYLESDEQDMPAGVAYGYPGSTAIVTVGAMGHTWPAGIPASDTDPGVDPVDQEANLAPDGQGQNNWEADQYGNAVGQQAIDAVSGGRGFYLDDGTVNGATRNVKVEDTNPVLLAASTEPSNPTPLGGYKIQRSITPPWGYGDVFVSKVTTLRVGDIPFYAVPGEPYPSIKFSLNQQVHAPVQFIFGLANDQLGYVEEPRDYNGAFQCSTTDEWFFTISPISAVTSSGSRAPMPRRSASASARACCRHTAPVRCRRRPIAPSSRSRRDPAGSRSDEAPRSQPTRKCCGRTARGRGARRARGPGGGHAGEPGVARRYARRQPRGRFPDGQCRVAIRADPAWRRHRDAGWLAGSSQLQRLQLPGPVHPRGLADAFRRRRDPHRR